MYERNAVILCHPEVSQFRKPSRASLSPCRHAERFLSVLTPGTIRSSNWLSIDNYSRPPKIFSRKKHTCSSTTMEIHEKFSGGKN